MVERAPSGQALSASPTEPVPVSALSGDDPSRDEWPPLTASEMNEAFDELHGRMIRRPGDVCDVRKSFLAVALVALDRQIRVDAGSARGE